MTIRKSSPATGSEGDTLYARARALRLAGLLAHWEEVAQAAWVPRLLQWEEEARSHNSMERRFRRSNIGAFKPMADFDWAWPKLCDRPAIEELLTLQFMAERANAVLIGPNGIGKSTIARNIAYQALCAGHTVLFVEAAAMLSPASTARLRCSGACAITQASICFASTRSGTSRTPTSTPICFLN
jgi:DNA replication protein DnaC